VTPVDCRNTYLCIRWDPGGEQTHLPLYKGDPVDCTNAYLCIRWDPVDCSNAYLYIRVNPVHHSNTYLCIRVNPVDRTNAYLCIRWDTGGEQTRLKVPDDELHLRGHVLEVVDRTNLARTRPRQTKLLKKVQF